MSSGNVFAVTCEQKGVVELAPGGRQQVVFNAQNVSGNLLEGRARIVVDMPAQESWYTIQEVEREFAAQEVHQFLVDVAIPEDALEGRTSFALEVDSVERPDEDFGRSQKVLVVVQKTDKKKKGIPWWVWLIVGAGVVIVGVVIALLVSNGGSDELSVPEQLSPDDGQVFSHFPRTTMLNWTTVAGATEYEVVVQFCQSPRCTEANVTPWATDTVTASSFTTDFVGAQPGRWRVRAIGANGEAGDATPWREFRYTR